MVAVFMEELRARAKYGRRETDLTPPRSATGFLTKIWWIDLYLGHGRMMESALVFVKLQYAAMLLTIPKEHVTVIAFSDINAPPVIFAFPFLLAAVPSFMGLCLNAMGYVCSKWFRIFGATVGIWLWSFILIKNVYLGHYAAGVNPWCTMGIAGSIWIIRRGLLGLPVPGKIGAT